MPFKTDKADTQQETGHCLLTDLKGKITLPDRQGTPPILQCRKSIEFQDKLFVYYNRAPSETVNIMLNLRVHRDQDTALIDLGMNYSFISRYTGAPKVIHKSETQETGLLLLELIDYLNYYIRNNKHKL